MGDLKCFSDIFYVGANLGQKLRPWEHGQTDRQTHTHINRLLSDYSNYSRHYQTIGVASCGALGHVPLLDFQLFNLFQVTSEPHKLWHSTPCGCLSGKIYRPMAVSPFIASIW